MDIYLNLIEKQENIDKAENMMKWTSQDAEDYLNAMKKALVEEAKICQ